MTSIPPVRRRSLEEIAAGSAPRRSLEEIAASTAPPDDPYKPSLANLRRQASESTQTKATAHNVTGLRNDWVDAGRQFAQGATLSGADELEAALRAPFSEQTYPQIRDEIRGTNSAFARENPKATMALQVVGGLATGRMVPGLNKIKMPGVANATWKGRAVNSAVQAGAVGGVTGAASAEGDALNRMKAGAIGAGVGSVFGGGLSVAGEIVGGGVRAVRNALDGARAIPGAPTPPRLQDAGARRTLATLARKKQSVDDLATWSQTADPHDIVAEGIGPLATRELGSANRLGHRPEKIITGLNERAADEGANLSTKLEALTGVKPQDAATVKATALTGIEKQRNRLYARAYKQPDIESPEIAQVVVELNDLQAGRSALNRARELAVGNKTTQALTGETPTISVANLHNLRQGLDHAIREAETAGDDQLVRMLAQRRTVVDDVVKKAGGKTFQRADKLHEQAMARAEGFAAGERLVSGQDMAGRTQEGVDRVVGEARDKDALREGAASSLISKVFAKGDGTGGNVVNPAGTILNSPQSRATGRVGFKDDATFGEAVTAAERVGKRMETRRDVLQNSATAQRLINDQDALDGVGGAVVNAAKSGPVSGLMALGGKAWDATKRAATGHELDAQAEILMAGAPGAMTREQAIEILRRLQPGLARQQASAVRTRASLAGLAGGKTGSAVTRR